MTIVIIMAFATGAENWDARGIHRELTDRESVDMRKLITIIKPRRRQQCLEQKSAQDKKKCVCNQPPSFAHF